MRLSPPGHRTVGKPVTGSTFQCILDNKRPDFVNQKNSVKNEAVENVGTEQPAVEKNPGLTQTTAVSRVETQKQKEEQ